LSSPSLFPPSLQRLGSWAHRFLGEALGDGDLAVDLTAGNGHDTLFLWQQVAPSGEVVAFDLQEEALVSCQRRLTEAAVPLSPTPAAGSVSLVAESHENLEGYLTRPPRAVIANLGYLPGSHSSLATEASTSVAALTSALDLLAGGGRLAVTVYSLHPGAAQEAAAVTALFSSLSPNEWETLQLQLPNRKTPPSLLMARKR